MMFTYRWAQTEADLIQKMELVLENPEWELITITTSGDNHYAWFRRIKQ